MDETVREGSCACGALTVRAWGEPTLVGMCHCQACQRRTGSAFGLGAFFRAGQLELSGATSTFSRLGESGTRLTFHFCPGCGSNVWWTRDSRPGLVAVAAGAFADADFPAPVRRVWTEHQHGWLETLADLPGHPRQPT